MRIGVTCFDICFSKESSEEKILCPDHTVNEFIWRVSDGADGKGLWNGFLFAFIAVTLFFDMHCHLQTPVISATVQNNHQLYAAFVSSCSGFDQWHIRCKAKTVYMKSRAEIVECIQDNIESFGEE